MKNPPHPGGIVLRQCIEPLSLTTAARLSKVSRGRAESWLSQQALYDLAGVRAGASSSSGWHWFSSFKAGHLRKDRAQERSSTNRIKVKKKSLWLGNENLG